MGVNSRTSFIFLIVSIISLLFLVSGCDKANKACNYDGIVQSPELCDDGNKESGDSCDQCVPTICGDDVVNDDLSLSSRSAEQCDNKDQSDANKQCEEKGFLAPCNKETCQCSGIAPPKKMACNQNSIVEAGEECDAGEKGDSTCTPDCTLTYCGDEKVQAPNGKDLNNKQPGFNEACDAGKDPTNLTDPVARNAHAFCQVVLGDPLAACMGCRCRAPPWSCTDGALAALFGPVGPLPPGAVCKDDCAANLGATWACDAATCVCKPLPPPPDPTCVDNTINLIFTGNALPNLPKICKDDCKDLLFAPADIFCDQKDCKCKILPPPQNKTQTSCSENTFSISLLGEAPPESGKSCKDDCAELAKSFGGEGDELYCDTGSCVCKPKEDDPKKVVSCVANKENALSTGRIETPTSDKLCKNDCPKGEWCSEDCVCQGRFATPRCGDGYISSIFIGGGGVEECDLGGKNGIPAKPDTCTEGKVCQDCKCVEVTDLISETCPQGTGPDSKCAKGCYPSDACEVATYTKNTETPCYACKPKCPLGAIYNNPSLCKQMFGACVEFSPGCYGPADLEEEDDEQIGIGQTPGETIQVGGGGGDTTPQPLNCQNECASRGKTVSQPSYGSYILGYLQQYSCVSGASIQLPGTLTLQGPAGDTCKCY